jgi:hypothetical protein
MATTVPAPAPPAAPERCDRCPATARVRVELRGGELVLCAHHTRVHHVSLMATGATLVPLIPPPT